MQCSCAWCRWVSSTQISHVVQSSYIRSLLDSIQLRGGDIVPVNHVTLCWDDPLIRMATLFEFDAASYAYVQKDTVLYKKRLTCGHVG